jgi:hypothetical protein
MSSLKPTPIPSLSIITIVIPKPFKDSVSINESDPLDLDIITVLDHIGSKANYIYYCAI